MALSKAQSCPQWTAPSDADRLYLQQLCVASSCITLIISNRLHIPYETGGWVATPPTHPPHISRRFSIPQPHVPQFPISPGCMIDAGQHGVWPRRPKIALLMIPHFLRVGGVCGGGWQMHNTLSLKWRSWFVLLLVKWPTGVSWGWGGGVLTGSHNTLDASFHRLIDLLFYSSDFQFITQSSEGGDDTNNKRRDVWLLNYSF